MNRRDRQWWYLIGGAVLLALLLIAMPNWLQSQDQAMPVIERTAPPMVSAVSTNRL